MSTATSISEEDFSDQNESDEESIWNDMKNKINSIPTMVFSVIGDSDNLVPNLWPKSVFQKALIEAGKTGGYSWIIYRGERKGVSKVVRDAYVRYLGKSGKCSNKPVKLIDISGAQEKKDFNSYETKNRMTDEFLLDFEKFVSEQEYSIKMPVPIAIIVCEGDIETIHHITKALNNKVPAIIIKGSGKAADFVMDYLENSSMLFENARMALGFEFDDSLYKKLKKNLNTIKKNIHLVGIFDLTQDDPSVFSNIVGKAVTNSWIQRDMYGFRLHNDSLQKKENITEFLECLKEKSSVNLSPNPEYSSLTSLPLWLYSGYMLLQRSELMEKYGSDLLLAALKTNQQEYVKLLLEEGVELKQEHLPDLYKQVTTIEELYCTHIKWILKDIPDEYAEKIFHFSITTKNEHPEHIMVSDRAACFCRKILQYRDDIRPMILRCGKLLHCKNEKKSIENNRKNDVLLWAVLSNRKELATLFWMKSNHCILTGLICSALLNTVSKKAREDQGAVSFNDLEEHAKLFQLRSIDIIDDDYGHDPEEAMHRIDSYSDVWQIRSTPLAFAYENFIYDVVAHPCSAQIINRKWYNSLQPNIKSAYSKPWKFLNAPRTKYIRNYMTFFLMLMAYSTFVLTSIKDRFNTNASFFTRLHLYYIHAWFLVDIMEEICKYSDIRMFDVEGYYRPRSLKWFRVSMNRYFNDFWKVMDPLSYVLFLLAEFFNYYEVDKSFTVSRQIYSLSLLLMYLRFLEVFRIFRTIGTSLVMIKAMIKDLFQFVLITLFVVLGVGIYYHANLWPDHHTFFDGGWTEWRIWTILHLPYWQLYGEPNLDSLKGGGLPSCSNITSGISLVECPQEDWTVPALAAMYMLFSNILLVSLVIAMFSHTFQRIKENSEKLWHFEMYTVTNDFEWRPITPFLLYPLEAGYRAYQCRRKRRLREIDPLNTEM